MIKSMTGYGSAKGELPGGNSFLIEIKSVNNRFLDTNIRAPRSFLFAEDPLKNIVSAKVKRGKVDVFVTIEGGGSSDTQIRIDEDLARAYLDAYKSLQDKFCLPDDLTLTSFARIPDILTVEKKEQDNEAVLSALSATLDNAIDAFNVMRTTEGKRLKDDVLAHIGAIEGLLSKIEEAAPRTAEAYYNKLLAKISELLADRNADETRIITEAAVFADHIAIDEETVRLHSHINQLIGMLEDNQPIGKKMDFLIQEFNREANTIGSKCQDSDIAHLVVDLKSEIEKIREQIQNIE